MLQVFFQDLLSATEVNYQAAPLQVARTLTTAADAPQQGALHADDFSWGHVPACATPYQTKDHCAPLLVGEAHGCAWERPGGTHCSVGLHAMGLVLPKGPIAQSENMPKLFSSVLCGRSTHTQPPVALVCFAASKGLRPGQEQAIVSWLSLSCFWEAAHLCVLTAQLRRGTQLLDRASHHRCALGTRAAALQQTNHTKLLIM